ncbi:P-loop containing nucleoside triphosphate hydrolase protein, partial [Pisolithus albus]
MASSSLNIILFGETGVGKSSVINLIAGRPVAEVSSDVDSCTMDMECFQFTIGSKKITIWETVGPEKPQVGYAITKAHWLITKLTDAGGVDLLLFCIRGNKVTATALSNYGFFYEVLCNKQVPVALVITHVEREYRMEDWWTRNE